MKRKIASLFLLIFFSSIIVSAYSATDNVIVRVGYPRLGQNQYVGTVRIYESDATIDSIQNGDIFTIFLDNAEFITSPTLVERGRFDLNIISGGNDGDRYITYEFTDPSPARTGRVIIDFAFDDMRVLGGDVTARVDSVQSGVSSGYFSLGGSEEEKKPEPVVKEEEVNLSHQQLTEAKEKKVNILVQNNEYQILIPNKMLYEKVLEEVIEKEQNLKIMVKREVPSDIKYLTDMYSLSLFVMDKDGNEKSKITEFENSFYLKIKDTDVKDKRNVKGVITSEPEDKIFNTHYDVKNDHIIIQVSDYSDKISLIRRSNNRELVFNQDEFAEFEGENYLPVRQVADYYGWNVAWNPFTRTVNLQKNESTIEVKDYIIVRERSYISADFIRENFSAPVFELEDQIVLKFN